MAHRITGAMGALALVLGLCQPATAQVSPVSSASPAPAGGRTEPSGPAVQAVSPTTPITSITGPHKPSPSPVAKPKTKDETNQAGDANGEGDKGEPEKGETSPDQGDKP